VPKAAILAAALVLVAGVSRAQPESGTYGASFLKIPVGARLMSSPDAVAGMRPDASLIYSNPAFLAGIDNAELFASSSQWLDALSFSSFGAVIPLGAHHTVLGIGTTLLYSGGLQGYDDATNIISEQSYYDLGVDVALAHHFASTGLSLAAGVTYVREHVLPSDGSGYAFQAGASYWHGSNLFHAAMRDMAGSVSFASGSWQIAPEWMAGAGHAFNSGVGQFFTGLQASSSGAYGNRIRLGVDYAITSSFTLRSGFNDNLDATQPGPSINAGFGMRYGAFALEYAYSPQEFFSGAHTFSLSYRFGGHAAAAPGVVVPEGDLSPPVPVTQPQPGPPASPVRHDQTAFILVGGSHASRESAQSEARTLELLKVPATVEPDGARFRVVVGRYSSFDEADRARLMYRGKGHEFLIKAR
jgi:hypothetical protein